MKPNQYDAIFTFIAKGNRNEIINKSEKGYPNKKECYLGRGAVKLDKKFIDFNSPLLRGFDNVMLINKGQNIKLRLSDVLRHNKYITIKNPNIFFRDSEKILLGEYQLNISDLIAGCEQEDWRGDENERLRVSKLTLLDKPGYRIGNVTLCSQDDLISLVLRGSCFIEHVEQYYGNNRNNNMILCMKQAEGKVYNKNFGYDSYGIMQQFKNALSYSGIIFANLKNLKRKIEL